MAEQLSYLIIGNGIAGVTAAEILRAEDSAADITVIADDPFPVYYRPALKDYLAGRVREDKLWARPTSFYQDQRIRFLSERVVGIQVGQHSVQLQNGRQVGYSRLLLANGARPSTLKCPGLDLAGVTTLRTVADYQMVQSRLGSVRRVVVTGSGTLALETIETLRHRGFQVVHLLRRRTLWSEVLDVTASDLVLQQERRDGVDVRIEEEIAEVTGTIGIAAILIAFLHENYDHILHDYCSNLSCFSQSYFGTSALYALILLVISGIVGRLLDLWQAHIIARDASTNGVGIVQALEERILKLEYTVERLSAGKSEPFKAYCLQALDDAVTGRLEGNPPIPPQEQTDFQRVQQTLVDRARLVASLQQQKRARLIFRTWRYVHIALAVLALLVIIYHAVLELLTSVLGA